MHDRAAGHRDSPLHATRAAGPTGDDAASGRPHAWSSDVVLPRVSAPLARARVLSAADPRTRSRPASTPADRCLRMAGGQQIAKASGYTHR